MTTTQPQENERTHAKGSLVMSVADAAHALGVSDDLIYDLIQQGVLPCLQFGRRKVIPRVVIDATIEQTLEGFDAEVLRNELRRPER